MKRTKNVLAAALIAALIIPTIQSCKKGDGDPFISLRSRKARVAGEWTFSKLREESSYSNTSSSSGQQSTSSGTSVYEVDGTTVRVNHNDNSDGNSQIASGSGSAEAKATFGKDGTFKITYRFTNINMNYDGNMVIENNSIESTGTWNFLGGVEDDYKKKERIILNVTREVSTSSQSTGTGATAYSNQDNSTYTYQNGENSQIWHLTTLKNKEMVVEATTNSSGSYMSSYNYAGTTGSDSGTSTDTGKLSGTLTQD